MASPRPSFADNHDDDRLIINFTKRFEAQLALADSDYTPTQIGIFNSLADDPYFEGETGIKLKHVKKILADSDSLTKRVYDRLVAHEATTGEKIDQLEKNPTRLRSQQLQDELNDLKADLRYLTRTADRWNPNPGHKRALHTDELLVEAFEEANFATPYYRQTLRINAGRASFRKGLQVLLAVWGFENQ